MKREKIKVGDKVLHTLSGLVYLCENKKHERWMNMNKYYVMGEIADDMNDGTACCLCGQYFDNPKDEKALYTHGYPVVCWGCWDDLTKEQKKEYQKAKVKTL